jgi:acyl-coenzyme A thioesterase PaaI-like protein
MAAQMLDAGEEPSQPEGVYLNGDTTQEPENMLLKAVLQSPTMQQFRLSNGSRPLQTSRTLLKFSPQHIANQMTLASLSGPHGIACEPYIESCDEVGAIVAAYYLGPKLAGHAGRIHGGLLMTLFDECMGRACFPRLPGKTAVTAKIDVNFRKPVLVDGVVLVKAWTESVEGRKAWVKAAILQSGDEGQPCAEASALFIEPRNAAELDVLI